MPKRKSGAPPPARRKKRSSRPRRAPQGASRRTVLAGSLGALVAGIGIGALVGRSSSGARIAAIPPPPKLSAAAPPRIVELAPTAPLMEEEPLPGDAYVPEPRPVPPVPPRPVAAPIPVPAPVPVPAPAPTAPRVAPGTQLAWQRNARPFIEASSRPVIAIVIDDLGLDHARTERAIALDGAVTLAFMTYAERLPHWLGAARQARHELVVHVPMQPESATVDPGPNALVTGLAEAEILHRLRWGLERMDGYVGANNHMGSRFTEWANGMRVVMDELKARGLLFLDSRTTPHSAGAPVAAAVELPFAERNVFLDNETTDDGVRQQLGVLEGIARKRGTAVGIGHPHDATLSVLAEWLPTAESRGITVVPLTSAMRHAVVRT